MEKLYLSKMLKLAGGADSVGRYISPGYSL